MQQLSQNELVGFVELQVGSQNVKVPVRAAKPSEDEAGERPLASFEVEGDTYAILVRGDASSRPVEKAVAVAARDAIKHLSRKLLN